MARFTPLDVDWMSLTTFVAAGLIAAGVVALIPLAAWIDERIARRAGSRIRRGETNRAINGWVDEDAPRKSGPT